MAKFENILEMIDIMKKSNCDINIELTRQDILKICKIHPKDQMSNYSMSYISNWINAYLKYHIPTIKVLIYGESVYITDSQNVKFDNRHAKFPSGNMHRYKFDFSIKRLNESEFTNHKNCGMSNIIIPKCGVYIITTDEGQYIGSSINICNRLRQHVSEDLQKFKSKSRVSIDIYECIDEQDARNLEKKLIEELRPKLNE